MVRLSPLFRWTMIVNRAHELFHEPISGQGGTRTHTLLRGPDFESGASAIPPLALEESKGVEPHPRQGTLWLATKSNPTIELLSSGR